MANNGSSAPSLRRRDEARAFLVQELAYGPDGFPSVPVSVLVARAKRRGISARTLYRAAPGVVRDRQMVGRGVGRESRWSLQANPFGVMVTGVKPTRAPGRQHEDPKLARDLNGRLRGELLVRRKLSYAAIGQQLGLAPGQVERLLGPGRPTLPRPYVLARLHSQLGLDVNRLLCGDGAAKAVLPATELEKQVQAYLVTTLETSMGWNRGTVQNELATLGELLPHLVKSCRRRMMRARRRRRKAKNR